MSSIPTLSTRKMANRYSRLKAILLAGFVAGTLDLSTALIVWSVIIKKVPALQILQGVASGVFGKVAFSGGMIMPFYGVLFHYIIAFLFTIFYFLVYPLIPFLQKQRLISGLLYGIFAWAVMSYLVLPLSKVHMSPFKWSSALISISILMVCIGLPISLLAYRYYNARERRGESVERNGK